MAIKSYRNEATKQVAEGENSKLARKVLPVDLHANARKKLAFLDAVRSIVDLRSAPRGYGWEKLSGDRKGQHSIRVNDQYRICFKFNGEDCEEVEITDYH